MCAPLYNREATCGPLSTIQADATLVHLARDSRTVYDVLVCFVPPQSWFKTTAVA